MNNKVKVAGLFIGITIWVDILSLGLYRFSTSHPARGNDYRLRMFV